MAIRAVAILILTTISCSSTGDTEDLECVVYKTPWCGCCGKWADHLRENGFAVEIEEVTNLAQSKLSEEIGREIASCHIAIAGGYVIEGHVPADLIKRLLKERPPVVGLTVPGMPLGSPGMEADYSQPYEVLTFDREGNTEVYAKR